jgi:hypothetical protein
MEPGQITARLLKGELIANHNQHDDALKAFTQVWNPRICFTTVGWLD